MAERNYIRTVLDSLPSYVPGKPAPAGAFKASSNESPFPPLPEVHDAVLAELGGLNRYPDMAVVDLRAQLGEQYGVQPSQVHVSTGASAVISDLVRATVDQGTEVVYAWRSFEAYPIIVQSHVGVGVGVPLTDAGEHDLEAMADAITDNTRLVLLCSPNNPTGCVIGTEALEAFLERVPDAVTVGLDEAYVEFADPEKRADSAALFARFDNLVRLRTFSKVHGMAGLRLGYAIAHPKLAEALAKVTVPFGSNSLAQAAARTALAEPARTKLAERVQWLRAERERVLGAVRGLELGLTGAGVIPDAQGNFIYLPLGERSGEFAARAAERGLLVRAYGNDGVRITIAEEAANDLAIALITEWAGALAGE
ncbi:MAG: histidinol-phosphate transaminase [Dermabacter sp.]|nr:histidinol-phosphate transaminase [Dermabacter sp.]